MKLFPHHLISLFYSLDFRTDIKYPGRLAFSFLQILMMIFLFFFISETLGNISVLNSEYFPFVASGLAFQYFFSGVINASSEKLEEYRDYGVIEEVLLGKYPAWQIMLSLGFKGISISLGKSLMLLMAISFVFDLNFHFVPLLLTIFLMFNLAINLSFTACCSFLMWKRFSLLEIGGSIVTLFLSGIYFPINVLPRALQALAFLNPLQHGIAIFRSSIGLGVAGKPDFDASLSFLIIILSTFAALLVNLVLYRRCMKKIMHSGVSSHF